MPRSPFVRSLRVQVRQGLGVRRIPGLRLLRLRQAEVVEEQLLELLGAREVDLAAPSRAASTALPSSSESPSSTPVSAAMPTSSIWPSRTDRGISMSVSREASELSSRRERNVCASGCR